VDNSHARALYDATPDSPDSIDSPDTPSGARIAPEEPRSVTTTRPARAFLQRANGTVSDHDRARMFGQKAVTVWLTGLSGAGKSTIAYELERSLSELGHPCYVLDGDNIRHGLAGDLGFTKEDRRENIRRVAHVAQLMNDAGLIVITALISPMDEDRAMAREIIGGERFVETYLSASVDDCARRDPVVYRRVGTLRATREPGSERGYGASEQRGERVGDFRLPARDVSHEALSANRGAGVP
jgi:adenylylsulfate kinase